MISTDLARELRDAGLRWHPASGDSFHIERPDFETDVFTVSEMAIEPHEFDTGTILGFNGTTEWALDSLALEHTLWLPREDQLRSLLGESFRTLNRLGQDKHRVEVVVGKTAEHFDAPEPSDAYAAALLMLIELAGGAHPRR